jgi:uncharacterized protein YrrD
VEKNSGGGIVGVVDEGDPIAYTVLEKGVPVLASGGEQVGTVEHVIAAPEQDIFHGIVMTAGHSARYVEADQIAALHERGVDLRISAEQAAALPAPEHGGRTFVAHADEQHGSWRGMLDRIEGKRSWRRE